MDSFNVKPFLRWAGGKTWMKKHMGGILNNKKFNAYHEPFLGGGAIFFSLDGCKKAFLSDINSELIEAYIAIKNNPQTVISALYEHQNTEEYYYMLRKKELDDKSKKAARFIYLNQTSYNGLYRVNKEGKYNVPYGFRKKIYIAEKNILLASEKLQNCTIECKDFSKAKNNINKDDLVFLDPPYTVSHNNNGFIEYNKNLFSLEDQQRLSGLIDYIKSVGAFYIMTNAAHQAILDIFNKGDRMLELSRACLIGGTNAKRGKTTEYVFTNIN